jgi:hypothetical protein
VPVGRVVVDDSEVGAADDLEVVGQARVSNREVIRGQVGGLGVAGDEGRVGVAQNLPVVVVLHHDDEDVIEARDLAVVILGPDKTGSAHSDAQSNCDFLQIHFLTSWVGKIGLMGKGHRGQSGNPVGVLA